MSKFIVLADRINVGETLAISEAVKEHSSGWWHHHADTWIVNGHTAAKWRDIVKKCLDPGPSSVLVLQLPESKAERGWAYSGPKAKVRCEWIRKNYRGG